MTTKLSGIGKLPPQAIDLEKYVIGAMITDRNAYLMIADILKPGMFYKEQHSIIFETIEKMSINQVPIDLISLQAELTKSGKLEYVGGIMYLVELSDSVVSTISLEHNSRIIAEKFMSRSLINLSAETINSCYDETKDIFETLDLYESQRDEIVSGASQKKEISNDKAVRAWMERKIKLAESDNDGITGVPTGFKAIDKNTGGWQNSDLVILAARPSMGKTALMIKFMIESAQNGIPVMVFSLEMDMNKLIDRMISCITGIEIDKIMKPEGLSQHDWHRMHNALNEIEALPIIWDDSANPSVIEVSAKIKRNKRLHGIGFVCIDYLQLIKAEEKKGGNREREIAKISRGLKMAAKESDIPILALSQLSRAVESRPGNGKRPMLSDLRESGSIEQDADQVLFLYRPEYYGLDEDEMGNSTRGKAEIIIAKNRNGETDMVNADFDGRRTKFSDPDDVLFENDMYGHENKIMSQNALNDVGFDRYENESAIKWGDDDRHPF